MTTFWGLICESGNRYKQKVEAQFHLTMAALDPKSQKGNKSASVYVENLGTEYLVCNLNGEKKLQERLDLMFGESEEITFFVKGEGTVHLTGYEMPEEADIGFGDEEFSDEEEALPIANGKRKPEAQAASPLKKLKAAEPKAQNVIDIDTSKLEKKPDNKKQQPAKQQQNAKPQAQQKKPAVAPEDDDDELDGIDSDIDSEELDKMINQESDDEMDEDDEFDDDDDEEDDLEDDDDSEDEKLKSVQQKVKGKANGPAAGKPAQANKPQQQQANKQTPNANKPQQTPNKQQNQKNGQTPKGNQQAKTPQQGQQNKGNQNNQNRQQTPFVKNNKQQQNNSGKKSDGGEVSATQSKGPQVNKLPNGLIIQDVQEGHGPEAKKGKYLHMNYVGKLTNNRVFDKTTNKPFSFRLGMGEVIKGWDQGIQGMKVGGKRRLTIPANLGYGRSGAGDIPPNATLVFDVELKSVS